MSEIPKYSFLEIFTRVSTPSLGDRAHPCRELVHEGSSGQDPGQEKSPVVGRLWVRN